jgi:hypothetical protein
LAFVASFDIFFDIGGHSWPPIVTREVEVPCSRAGVSCYGVVVIFLKDLPSESRVLWDIFLSFVEDDWLFLEPNCVRFFHEDFKWRRVSSIWKSGLVTGKRPELNWTLTD